MTKTLHNNEEFTMLEIGQVCYIKNGTGTTGSNFLKMPEQTPVNPEVNELVSTEEQTVELDLSAYCTDNNLNIYFKLVGARPKSRRR